MTVTFKQFVEGSGAPSGDFDATRDPNKEIQAFNPRSDGEDAFKNYHTKRLRKHGYPEDVEGQFDGNTDKDDSKEQSRISDQSSGERDVNYQGTSKLPDKSGYGKSSYRAADKQDGDKKVPRVDYESYAYGLKENVIEDLRKIADSGDQGEVELRNGDTIDVDEDSARSIIDAYDDLSSRRQKKYEKLLGAGETSFMKGLDFANSV